MWLAVPGRSVFLVPCAGVLEFQSAPFTSKHQHLHMLCKPWSWGRGWEGTSHPEGAWCSQKVWCSLLLGFLGWPQMAEVWCVGAMASSPIAVAHRGKGKMTVVSQATGVPSGEDRPFFSSQEGEEDSGLNLMSGPGSRT